MPTQSNVKKNSDLTDEIKRLAGEHDLLKFFESPRMNIGADYLKFLGKTLMKAYPKLCQNYRGHELHPKKLKRMSEDECAT